MFFHEFAGATDRFLDEEGTFKNSFFKPYKDASDLLINSVSVITAPIVLTSFALSNLLQTGASLLNMISSLLELEFSDAKDYAGEGVVNFIQCIGFTLAAIISPLANLIDVIGSTIATISDVMSNEQEQSMRI